MTYNLLIKPAAERDLAEVLEWYNGRGKKLATEFLIKYEEALEQVSLSPEQFQKHYGETRIVFLRTYPYGIHYILEEDRIYVIAVLHTKRKPGIRKL